LHKNQSLLIAFLLFVIAFSIIVFIVGTRDKFDKSSHQDPFSQARTLHTQLQSRKELQVATLAGGCFWCLEPPFENLPGVEAVIAGYTGGQVPNPTYDQVATGTTGHREAVQIFFYPQKVNFSQILDLFWLQIDPTDPGGQFTDRGPQYQTAIYYHSPEQKTLAEQSKTNLDSSGRYQKPIVTNILSAQPFYPAEDYHQDFYRHSAQRYKRYHQGSGRQQYFDRMESK
jgi:methionine-S-sulfoxide reductase